MTRKLEAFALNGVFVNRCGEQGVDFTSFEVCHGGFERGKGVFAHFGIGHPKLNVHFLLPHIYQIGAFGIGSLRLIDEVEAPVVHPQHLAVVRGRARRAVHDGRANVGNARLHEGFDDHLHANAIEVAYGNAESNLMLHGRNF